MPVIALGEVGSNSNKTSGTSLAVTNTSASVIPAGTLLLMVVGYDNHASTTASTVTASNTGGGAWTQRLAPVGSGATTTAGSGIWHSTFSCRTTSDIAVGGTLTTLTFGTAVVGKAAIITGWQGVQEVLRGTVTSATSTGGNPSVTTGGTAPVAGDLVIGTMSCENSAAPTADSDTSNGSWSAQVSEFTSGGQAATNISQAVQWKIVTAGGHQTYNPVGANDAVASVRTFIPAPTQSAVASLTAASTLTATGTVTAAPGVVVSGYRFYGSGTESGSTALAAQNTGHALGADYQLEAQLRLLVQHSSGGAVPSTADWTLQFEVNGSGTWTNLDVSGAAVVSTGGSLTHGGATTNRLTGGTGAFVAGEQVSANTSVSDLGLSEGNYTELVWGVAIPPTSSADAATDGDVLRFRITCNGAVVTMGQTPLISIDRSILALDAYRFYADGTEAGSAPLAAQDTGYTMDLSAGDVSLLLRVRMQETNAIPFDLVEDLSLQWEKNASGTWKKVGGELQWRSGSSSLTAGSTGNPSGAGQSLLGDGGTLTKVAFDLKKNGTPPVGNGITARLYAHTGTFGSGGLGTGAPLATSTNTVDPTTLPTVSGTLTEFTFSGGPTLVEGTPYVVIFYYDATGGTGTNCVGYRSDALGSHPGNRVSLSSTGTWTSGVADGAFKVTTSKSVPIDGYNSPNLTDQENTTNRLTGGTGPYTPGKVSEDGCTDDITISRSGFEEMLYAITVTQGDFTDSDVIRFRVTRIGVGITTSPKIPTITIGATVTQQATANLTATSTLTATAAAFTPTAATAAYSFDAGAGSTVADETGSGHTLTIGSGTTWATGHTDDGLVGTAGGAGASATTFPANTFTSAGTIMGWLRAPSTPSLQSAFGFWSLGGPATASSQFAVWARRDDFGTANVIQGNVRVNGGLNGIEDTITTPVDTWTHIALTFDGSSSRLYRNGVLVRTGSTPGTGPSLSGAACYVVAATAAAVDDVRVFNTALSQPEIAVLMDTPVPVSAGQVVAGTAALTATSTLTATGVRMPQASVALTATSTLTVTGVRVPQASAGLSATSTLTATAVRSQPGTVALTSTSTLAVSGVRVPVASAALAAVSTLTATAVRQPQGTVSLVASATLTATGVRTGTQAATTTLSATSALTVTGVRAQPAAAALSAVATLSTVGTRVPVATAALVATSTLTVTAVRLAPGSISLIGVATLTATASTLGQVPAEATLTATSTLTVIAARVQVATVAMTGVSSLTTSGLRVQTATVVMAASSVLTVTATRTPQGAVDLVAASTLTAASVRVTNATVALVAVAVLTATARTARGGPIPNVAGDGLLHGLDTDRQWYPIGAV